MTQVAKAMGHVMMFCKANARCLFNVSGRGVNEFSFRPIYLFLCKKSLIFSLLT